MKFDLSKIYLYEWEKLWYSELDNEIGVDAFRKLNSNQEESLETTKKEFEKIIKNDENLKSLEPEHVGSYYSQIFEREEWIIRELQRQQRYSLILSIYSFFEGRLKSICEMIEKEFDFKIKLKDLNSNDDLMKYWNYLEKVYEIEKVSIEQYFTPIKQYKVVRNIIAHQEGIVPTEKLKKVNIGNGLSIKELGMKNQIDLKRDEFATYLLDRMEPFLKELLLVVDKRFKEKTLHSKQS